MRERARAPAEPGPCVSAIRQVYLTLTFIVMPAALWSVQTMVYVPFLLNLCENVTFAAVFEWKPLPVTLWGTLPFHDQRTVVPFLTLIDFGENARPLTPTFLVAP